MPCWEPLFACYAKRWTEWERPRHAETQPERFDELQFGRFGCARPKGCSSLKRPAERAAESMEVTLVTVTGTSGPFRNLAQPLSIALFRTGESNEQQIDPGRTAGRIDRVL